MMGTLSFPMLLSLLSYTSISSFQFCVPHSRFMMNSRDCTCDLSGRWSEEDCETAAPSCEPGLVSWLDCGRCICQEDGRLSCDKDSCPAHALSKRPKRRTTPKSNSFTCLPLRSYYVNCSLCVCPESGVSTEAMCTKDALCKLEEMNPDVFHSSRNRSCLPQVAYLFHCLECVCSNNGLLDMTKCTYTCQDQHKLTPSSSNCRPGTFYMVGCNICFCLYNNNHPNGKYCTESKCDENNKTKAILRSNVTVNVCEPHKFTEKTCVYCPCEAEGFVSSKECFQQECLWNPATESKTMRTSCFPGEVVPSCSECLCPADGFVQKKYCSSYCSDENRIQLLETIIKDSLQNSSLINKELLRKDVSDHCDPNTIYVEEKNFCICSEKGTPIELCVPFGSHETNGSDHHKVLTIIDFNATCTPSTFVEFDCNTCFCSKAGKIDPDWCTYDDCEEAKATVEKNSKKKLERDDSTDTCVPGTIINMECNYCICTDSGLQKDKVCTKNQCETLPHQSLNRFSCFPLSYYVVGCNICYCPESGVKNVAKCTANVCEKDFLRSNACSAGELFAEDCNVCVCPPSGMKYEKVCSNKTCPEVFQVVNLPMRSLARNVTNLVSDLCFPGEEIVSGCRLCACPEMGLKSYAVCGPQHCDAAEQDVTETSGKLSTRQSGSDNAETNCVPGSRYIDGCQQCICTTAGQQHGFCRSLPTLYCDTSDPKNSVISEPTFDDKTRQDAEPLIDQELTRLSCQRPGRQQDACFVCDCDRHLRIVVLEHCFRSTSPDCHNATPSFLSGW